MVLENILHTSLLELVAWFGYLGWHFLLSQKRIFGWILKIIWWIAWIIFLFQNQNYIFWAVTIIVVTTMFYGLYKWRVKKFDTYTYIDTLFEWVTIMVAIFMISKFIFSWLFHLSALFETGIVIAEILWTILIAREKIYGWYSYIIMSSLASILVIFINPSPSLVLGILEWASIYFYYKGVQNFSVL